MRLYGWRTLLLAAKAGFDPAANDFPDLLEEARAIGLELSRNELPGRSFLGPPLGLGRDFLPVRHLPAPSAVAAFASAPAPVGVWSALPCGAWCASLNGRAARSVTCLEIQKPLPPQRPAKSNEFELPVARES
jgi:hypothetical protein